jgi:hypothetical protein
MRAPPSKPTCALPREKLTTRSWDRNSSENIWGPFRQCKQSAGDDRSFWILLKLDKEGTVKELLFYPETRLASCARDPLLKDKLPAPPHPAYWVSIYMQLSK